MPEWLRTIIYNLGYRWRRLMGRPRTCSCGRWEEHPETGCGVRWMNDSGAIAEGECSYCESRLGYWGDVTAKEALDA